MHYSVLESPPDCCGRSPILRQLQARYARLCHCSPSRQKPTCTSDNDLKPSSSRQARIYFLRPIEAPVESSSAPSSSPPSSTSPSEAAICKLVRSWQHEKTTNARLGDSWCEAHAVRKTAPLLDTTGPGLSMQPAAPAEHHRGAGFHLACDSHAESSRRAVPMKNHL